MLVTEKVPVAVAGGGGWGKNLVRNFASLPGADLKTICDLNRDRLESYAGKYPGIKTTSDFDKVLSDDSLKAVVIATPSDTHYDLIKRSLTTGRLHVFTEKPLALTSVQAEELVKLSEKNGLTLMVGHLLLYHPAVAELKAIVDSGELGEIYCIYSNRLNLGAVRKNENAWWSLAPHDISILLHLLSETPVSISAQGASFIQKGVEDLAFATLNFSGNTIAQVHVSWLDPHKMRKFTIVGSRKMAIFDDMEAVEKIKIYDKGVELDDPVVEYEAFLGLRSGDVQVPQINMSEPLKQECEHFLEAVAKGKPPLSDGRNGLEVVKVLEAGQESIANGGKTVYIPV